MKIVILGTPKTTTRERWWTSISAGIFRLALTQPAYYKARTNDTVIGSAMCFAVGAMGLLAGYFEWIANPLLVLSWIAGFRGRRYQAAMTAAIALALIVCFLFRSTMNYPLYQRAPIAPIVGHGLGYWLWMLSALIMVFGFYSALTQRMRSRRSKSV